MVVHVLEAEVAYLSRLGWTFERTAVVDLGSRLEDVRRAILEGLRAAAKGTLAVVGPRGGRRWSGRYFVRRSAWHVLDHAWEIEDRLE
jgi:hypothetical protein